MTTVLINRHRGFAIAVWSVHTPTRRPLQTLILRSSHSLKVVSSQSSACPRRRSNQHLSHLLSCQNLVANQIRARRKLRICCPSFAQHVGQVLSLMKDFVRLLLNRTTTQLRVIVILRHGPRSRDLSAMKLALGALLCEGLEMD